MMPRHTTTLVCTGDVFVRWEPTVHELSKNPHREAIYRALSRSRISITEPQRGQY